MDDVLGDYGESDGTPDLPECIRWVECIQIAVRGLVPDLDDRHQCLAFLEGAKKLMNAVEVEVEDVLG